METEFDIPIADLVEMGMELTEEQQDAVFGEGYAMTFWSPHDPASGFAPSICRCALSHLDVLLPVPLQYASNWSTGFYTHGFDDMDQEHGPKWRDYPSLIGYIEPPIEDWALDDLRWEVPPEAFRLWDCWPLTNDQAGLLAVALYEAYQESSWSEIAEFANWALQGYGTDPKFTCDPEEMERILQLEEMVTDGEMCILPEAYEFTLELPPDLQAIWTRLQSTSKYSWELLESRSPDRQRFRIDQREFCPWF